MNDQGKHKDSDAHSRSTSPVGAWQPIASAPTDGTDVLLAAKNDVGQWIYGVGCFVDFSQAINTVSGPVLWNWRWLYQPTLWMSIPTPAPPLAEAFAHDSECEAELTSHGYTPCRCSERQQICWCRKNPCECIPAPPLAEAQSAEEARTGLPSKEKEIELAESRGAERGRREEREAVIQELSKRTSLHLPEAISIIKWLRTRATQEGQ